MKNILFVCTGNTCRSPMAEALLRHKGKDIFRVKSAGVFAGDGSPAHPNAIKVLKDRNISFDHRSQSINKTLIDWADMIFTMTGNHKNQLCQQYPESIDKTYTLKEYILHGKDEEKGWKQFKKTMVDMLEKQSNLQHKKSDSRSNGDNKEREKKLQESIEKDMKIVRELEAKFPDLDIKDPFGGSVEDYEEACREIEDLIEKLVKNF
ncbi:low molecular weight protein arginine phosphatase [Scopulibacillus cellulosilyticus]|uniref:Low molecular weight protein arginine phosphatase n=1 Tax=Scopulibacillus cellulosilyticus TaxID=2665665 RepID=A0ABW2PU95_9BACL